MTVVAVQDFSAAFPAGSPPRTTRYMRNGIAAPAVGGRQVANQINTLLARRLRPLAQYSNVYGLHADFDSASTSDLTCLRFAFRTGPVTSLLRWQLAALPLLGSPTSSDVTVYLTLTPGLTSGGTSSTTTLAFSHASAGATLAADELNWQQAGILVSPDTYYRAEIHRTNLARIVSSSLFEVMPLTMDTTIQTIANDATSYFNGAPITQTQVEDLNLSADKVWRRGHPLGWWSTDLPGDERSRTSATAANMIDQTIGSPTSISPGWPVGLPYSGSLDSASVPVIFWAYAECSGGTGSVTFRDQNNATLGTISPVGAATWYAVSGNLTDNTNGTQTTKVDVFFAGDGSNACKVHAAGCFMDAPDDAVLASPTSVGFLPSTNYTSLVRVRGRAYAPPPYRHASATRRTPF